MPHPERSPTRRSQAAPNAASIEETGRVALSVIVPVYNSGRELELCLDALASSDCVDFEVLVVDDGSSDPIEPIVARAGFRYLRIEGPGGPARARNHGVEHVGGRCVVFIDADVCVHRDTLHLFAERFAADPSIDAVVGTYDDAPRHPSFLSQYKNLFHHYVHQDADGEISTFWSGCGAMRRDVFLEFGGFDELRYRRPAIEDIELGTWISKAGRRIVLDKRVRCQHLKRWTLAGLIKTDVFDRGIPWTRLMLRAGSVPNTLNVKPTQRLSMVLVYLVLLSVPAALFYPLAWVATGLFVVAALLFNLDFYRYFAARRGWGFALRTVPLHWLYFLYCGISVVAGTLLHVLRREAKGAPAAVRRVGVDGTD